MAIVFDRLLSLTGCNATNLAVFPITYLLQPAARSSEIGDLVPVNFNTLLRWTSSSFWRPTHSLNTTYLSSLLPVDSLAREFEYPEGLMMVGGV